MKEKLSHPTVETPASRVPAFSVLPPPRCYAQVGYSPRVLCAAIATARKVGLHWWADEFYCDQHKDETDISLNGEFVIRRVTVMGVVMFAGVDLNVTVAQAEAVAHLEQLVTAAGGCLTIERVTSSVGRYPAKIGAVDAAAPAIGPT